MMLMGLVGQEFRKSTARMTVPSSVKSAGPQWGGPRVVGPGTTEAEGITSKMVPRHSLICPLSCKVKECATCMW